MTTPCPKCGRNLKPSGVLEYDGKKYPAFQCDECFMNVELMGELTECALTFILKDGEAFDPGSEDGKLNFDTPA